MTRRESREIAVGLLYELSFDTERDPAEVFDTAVEERLEGTVSAFAKKLFFETVSHQTELDEKISCCADNWRIDRIGKVPLAVLRLAACEIGYFEEIPVEITVNEALELTRRFDCEESVGFVNGVLGKLAKDVVKPNAKQKADGAEDA